MIPIKWQAESLLGDLASWPPNCPVEITGLSADSRLVKPGDLFIAQSAIPEQRAQHIDQAIKKGAIAVVRDKDPQMPEIEIISHNQQTIPLIAIDHLREKVGLIAAKFYHHPSSHMTMIGVTGTNGKTSCSHFIAKGLEMADKHCGIIGTIGSGFPNALQPTQLTTPDATILQALLSNMQQQGAKAVSMEVSSHSLAQHRVVGIEFDIAVFTNLTRDHLDYHGDMTRYGQAKEKLFHMTGLKYAVINADDAFGTSLLEKFSKQLNCYAYSIENKTTQDNYISAYDIKCNHHGISAKVITPWGQGVIKTPLLGRFNLSNLLAALTVLGILEIPFPDILHYLTTFSTVPGRMQTLGGGKLPLVVVDYSHTPDALEKALKALREHCHGQLWCVFGCGGNRDPGKRELMGQIAERYSDQLVITDDNPRFEDPKVITDAIVKGLLCPWAAEVEHDRRAAIAHAIDCANANDIVLIAGKGHEAYQLIGDDKIPFNDVEVAEQQLFVR